MSYSTQQAELFVRTWYGPVIPYFYSLKQLVDFAINSWVFAKNIAGDKVSMTITSSIPTAATDGKTIFIPTSYFSEDFLAGNTDSTDYMAASIALVNGSQLHEALHIRYTPSCNIRDAIRGVPGKDADGVQLKERFDHLREESAIFLTLINLVEDVYIEARGFENHPHIMNFVQSKNDIFFGDGQVEARITALLKPEATQDDLVNMLILLKNLRNRDLHGVDTWQHIIDKVIESEKIKDQSLRIIHAYEIFKMISSASTADGKPMPQGNQSSSTGTESNQIFYGGKLSPEAMAQLIENGLTISEMEIDNSTPRSEVESGDFEVDDRPRGDGTDEFTAAVVAALAQLREEKPRVWKTPSHSRADEMKPRVIDVVTLTSKSSRKVEPDPKFIKLGSAMRYARQVNHHPGQLFDTGSGLSETDLYRIAIDGRIMHNNDSQRMHRGKPRVIILIDLSGSMSGANLVHPVTNAAYGMYVALSSAGVPVSVFGHTSVDGAGDRDVPAIYAIAAFNMPFITKMPQVTSQTAKRFTAVMGVNTSQNFDGVAIKYCSQRFTSERGSRTIIVMSDGQPHGGYNYSGDEALNHTINTIADVRRKGINVLSLSLTQHVMETNDKIYGPHHNMQAYGAHLTRTATRLVRTLALQNV